MDLWSEGLDYCSLADYYFFDRSNRDAGHLVDIILARRGSAFSTPLSTDQFVFVRGTGAFEHGIPSPLPASNPADLVWGYFFMAGGGLAIGAGIISIVTGACALPAGGYGLIAGGNGGVSGGVRSVQAGSAKKAEYARARNLAAYLEYRLAPYSP